MRWQRGPCSGVSVPEAPLEWGSTRADCFAGVWGHATGRRGTLEPGDAEEGLRAAAAIGDDRLQRSAGRGVHPESFTHGSSEQRRKWLRRGLESGDPNLCDTFDSARP